MKIALLTDGIHPYVIGGMQKHSYYLAKELAKQGHSVYLFHCNESAYDATQLEFFSAEEKANIKGFLIPFPRKNYFPLHYIYESYKYSQAIANALEPVLPEMDFIFAQGFSAWDLLNKKKLKNLPPIAVHFHGLEMFQKIPSVKSIINSFFLRRAVRKNLTMADYAISYGGKITAILNRIVDKSKIWEIPAGIEKSWFLDTAPTVSNKVRFVFIGRYERRKGIPELNEAITGLLRDHSFSFEFIGDIPQKHRVLYPTIKYHGKVTSENEIKQILSHCDVLVCPSYAEGMPNVIMEAMACSLAVIATNVGAVSVLVDQDNGWLIKDPAVKSISGAMQAAMAIQDNSLQQKKINSSAKIKNGFSVEEVTNKLIIKVINI